MLARQRFLTFLAFMLSCHVAGAQVDFEQLEAEEARMQQAFADNMNAVVQDLNNGSFDSFVRAIDQDDMIERIFGLRLIDQKIKRDFREDMQEPGQFAEFIESTHQAEAKDGIRARLLVVESRGDRGRAVVRFDMAFFQVNYMEYDLQLGPDDRLIINDWTDYLWGHTFSERMGLTMVQAQPNVNNVRKLIDFPNVREQQVFQVIEILKAARDFDLDRFFQIYDDLEDKLKRQRVVILIGLDATRIARKRRYQRTLLQAMDEHFPEEPLYALSLLDYYFPAERYQDAYNALVRLQNKLRIDDGVTAARLSSATLVMGRIDDADAFADRSISLEPDLELGWWSVFRTRVVLQRHADAIEALVKLRDDFGRDLETETLAKDGMFQNFIRSAEYQEWAAQDSSSDGG